MQDLCSISFIEFIEKYFTIFLKCLIASIWK